MGMGQRVARLRFGVGAASPVGSPVSPSRARSSRSWMLPARLSPVLRCPTPRFSTRHLFTCAAARLPPAVAAPGSCFLPPSSSKQARIQLSAPQDGGKNNPQACGRRQESLQHRYLAGNPSPAYSRGVLGWERGPTQPPSSAASHQPRGAGTPHAVPLRFLRSCSAPQHPQGNLAKDGLLAFTNCSCHGGACQAWAGLGAGLVPPVRLRGAFPPGAGPAAPGPPALPQASAPVLEPPRWALPGEGQRAQTQRPGAGAKSIVGCPALSPSAGARQLCPCPHPDAT